MTEAGTVRRSGFTPLPSDRLRLLQGWGMVSRSMGYVYRPSTVEGVRAVLSLARESGRTLVPRGSGYSYGDTALNAEQIVLDTTRLNRILAWNPETGIARVEPGVTIRDLWRHTLEDGWWPAVVPGAMYPTIGGCTAVNAHGKNNWRAGGFIDHIRSVEMLLPTGEVVTLSRERDPALFRAAIGGLGMLGIFLSIELQLTRVTSGLLRVREWAVSNLADMFTLFEESLDADYLVGWNDAFATGRQIGRGLVQVVRHVTDDPEPHLTPRPEYQDLPDTAFGIVPRSMLWIGMKPLVNDPGMRLLNTARFTAGRFRSGGETLVPHAQFQFFHDFVPNWKRSFKPTGILQYQVQVPEATARDVFTALLQGSQRFGHYPYLTVFKRHRRDDALLAYSVDGYSLSLDYHATPGNEESLRRMCSRFTREVVLPAGGRFYPAKDNVIDSDDALQSFGADAVREFLQIKRRLDPDGVLQSDLFRRLFAG